MTRISHIACLMALPVVLPGCSAFVDLLRAVDSAATGPIALLPMERVSGTGYDTRYSSVLERIQVVENRDGSPARFEAARLTPYNFDMSDSAPSSPGRVYVRPDDGWIAAGAVELLVDTVEYHVVMWRADDVLPAWRASDNIIHTDMLMTCDLAADYAPEIAAALGDFESTYDVTLVEPEVHVFDFIEIERPLGEWATGPVGWTEDGTLAVSQEVWPAINFSDANGVAYDEITLTSGPVNVVLTYAADAVRTPLSCGRDAVPVVNAPPVLDIIVEDVASTGGITQLGFRVDGAPVQSFLMPDRRFLLRPRGLRTSLVGPRNLPE